MMFGDFFGGVVVYNISTLQKTTARDHAQVCLMTSGVRAKPVGGQLHPQQLATPIGDFLGVGQAQELRHFAPLCATLRHFSSRVAGGTTGMDVNQKEATCHENQKAA